ncbi:serine hydrolase domain-containing protein [Halobacillus litoralis]|uniref:serine hydrolase domain-containing protein n=1 Tax=Halobacillus litoralis TaxID=45668 RepID=UPI001CD30A47|nr:serine hydrolase [Halobacillus litoralis]MCA1023705.1 beta-lactamase family protein [Halobacillus litoralis]
MRIHKELPEMIHDKSKDINFSGVVYVKDREQVLLKKAYGYADRAEKRLNTYNTRFGTASGSKLFTAVAVCQLVEKGKLEFDTPLADCLAIEFPYFDKDVTIHHLLTHTSGLPDYFDEEVMEDYEDLWKDVPVYKIETLKDFLPLFQKKPMNGRPGERFHYNNAAYILLGLIIEQQTGEAYTDYVQSEIFDRFGMYDSGYFSLDQLPVNTAIGYINDKEKGTWRTNVYSIPKQGGSDGGAFLSAPDMAKFWEALFQYELLSEEMTSRLLQPHVQVNEEVHYGYGIWLNQKDEHIYKYHVMGCDPGVSFRSSYYPDAGLITVVPSNQESGPFEVTDVIEDFLLGWNNGK